jgi:hypothetical protein
MELPSSTFNQSYCIFVGKRDIQAFNEFIKEQNWPGVKVLEATFDKNLACIVIPGHHAFMEYERILFKLSERLNLKSGGVWGQYGMGYKDKTWNTIE